MGFISVVLAVAYVIVIFQIANQGRKNLLRRIKYNKGIDAEKTVYNTQFSSKAEKGFIPYMFISLFCIGVLTMMYIIGKENIDTSELTYTLISIACWIGFIWMGVNSLYYGWISIATRGENLIIQDEKIIGTAISLKGLNIELIDIDVNMKDIKEIIIVKNEKVMGLAIVSMNIRTQTNNYEFIMPVDAEGTKAIIEKRISL